MKGVSASAITTAIATWAPMSGLSSLNAATIAAIAAGQ
jgi:hypothetical protein